MTKLSRNMNLPFDLDRIYNRHIISGNLKDVDEDE
jgi:hypothetical protein